MTTEHLVPLFEALSRIVMIIAIAFMFWWIIGRQGNCPNCGENLDLHQSSTRVAP